MWGRVRRMRPHHSRRERKAHFGELVQLGGSFYDHQALQLDLRARGRVPTKSKVLVRELLDGTVRVVQVAATRAQHRHGGFFASIGLAYGSAGLNCGGCSPSRESSLTGILRLGFTVSPHVGLGVESTGWAKTKYGIHEKISLISGVLYYYPSTSNNFWIKGGAGYSEASEDDDTNQFKQDGTGITFGVGYDMPVAQHNFAFVPYAAYVRQLSGKIKYNGTETGVSSHADIYQFGVSLGFRH